MKTTSGAHVILAGPVVLKYGRGSVGARVGAQARYMRVLGEDVTGRVYRSGRNWFLMERLPTVALGPVTYAHAAVHALRDVWDRPPDPSCVKDRAYHVAAITARAREDADPYVAWRLALLAGDCPRGRL